VNEQGRRLAHRFVEMDSDAASLGARRLQNEHQFVAHFRQFSRSGFEADKDMQGEPPR
jgi:hypothetical protein